MAKSLEKYPNITPGEYEGLWSAYNVNIKFRNGTMSGDIEVDEGVRGINCKCKIIVDEIGIVNVF